MPTNNFLLNFKITMHPNSVNIIGIMSGTSLDGLDIALCNFYEQDKKVHYRLIACETIHYETFWKERLQNAFESSAEQYFKLNQLYGKYIADNINFFLIKHQQSVNYIASHGHTIFHRPELGFSTQIGCCATIAANTGITTIGDFRSIDVALNGQGAPLVPIGDRDLFHKHASCLNIGGIANISFQKNGQTIAFDICIANMALNYLAGLQHKPYDENGHMASIGNISRVLLHQLESLETNNKSLGREWFESQFLPILNAYSIPVEDKLATCVEYCAIKISECLKQNNIPSVLISGGGAYNFFLIERLRSHYEGAIEIPTDEVIQFKEAIIFAYLGYLRVHQQNNALSSVTGASRNSVGGCIYLGKK